MNTPDSSLPVPVPPQLPEPSDRRNGKIARLPKALRDQINAQIQDGVPYLQIIENLGLASYQINEMNLSRWKDGGYLDWQREMHLVHIIESKAELAYSIAERSGQGNDAAQAVLQVIASNICRFLLDTDPEIIRNNLLSDADKFTRFINSMVRLAEGGIKCAIHKNHQEDRAAALAKSKAPSEKLGISEESLRLAEEKLKLM